MRIGTKVWPSDLEKAPGLGLSSVGKVTTGITGLWQLSNLSDAAF